MDIYRKGDTLPDLGSAGKGVVDCDAQDVNELIVQTKEETPIQIDAIGSDPSTYKVHDERMTIVMRSGLSHSYIHSGHAWIDIKDNISNGIYDTGELPLEQRWSCRSIRWMRCGKTHCGNRDRDGKKCQSDNGRKRAILKSVCIRDTAGF
ncbi:MAG: hypothetical protein ACLTDX_08375 [[Clostridium] innocuum]